MGSDANTVNIARRYHHGDLRAAAVAEGLRLLASRDIDALSLREVARGVGVSAASLYRHFPDKNALLAALAAEGLAELAHAQRRAAETAPEGAKFSATGRAYVRFALAHPALFRLIFTSPAPPDTGEAAEPEAFAMLNAYAAAIEGEPVGSEAARRRAIHAWSLVHGLAMLMLDGQIPEDDALIDRVIAP